MQEILMKTNSSRMVSPFTIVNANLYSIVQYRIMQVCFKFTVIIYNRPVLSQVDTPILISLIKTTMQTLSTNCNPNNNLTFVKKESREKSCIKFDTKRKKEFFFESMKQYFNRSMKNLRESDLIG